MRLLLGFGFLAAEVDKIGFGLGHGITFLYKSHSTFLLVRGTLHPIVANQLEVVVLLSLYLAVLDDQSKEEQFIDVYNIYIGCSAWFSMIVCIVFSIMTMK